MDQPLDQPMDPPRADPPWSAAQRFAFRFLFAYLVLYLFPFPLPYVPGSGRLLEWYSNLVNGLVTRVGRLVFHVAVTAQFNGSGDTTRSYVQVFCCLLLAAAAAVVWTILDRRRRDYARLHAWLRVYVRFSLAAAMISYGSYKVIQAQFPSPSLDRMVQPFGDASPMGLLWTFMGASKAYNAFGGAAEMLGGLLLTLRRTTLLGALVSIAVLANIVMLNFSYDVPVKLYSLHLLAMAAFLAAPDLRRLADFFLFDRTPAPAPVRPLFGRRWLHHGSRALRTVLVAAFAASAVYGSYEGMRAYGELAPKPPFYGIWNVDELAIDGQPRPPLVTDAARWRRVIFDYPQVVAIQLMDDSRHRYALELDQAKRTMKLAERNGPETVYTFAYQRPAPELLTLQGSLKGQRIEARLRRVKPSSFLLVNRGFHWINEYPFNR